MWKIKFAVQTKTQQAQNVHIVPAAPEGLMVGPGAAAADGVDAEALAGVVVVVPQAAAAVPPAGVGENLRARPCPRPPALSIRIRRLINARRGNNSV